MFVYRDGVRWKGKNSWNNTNKWLWYSDDQWYSKFSWKSNGHFKEINHNLNGQWWFRHLTYESWGSCVARLQLPTSKWKIARSVVSFSDPHVLFAPMITSAWSHHLHDLTRRVIIQHITRALYGTNEESHTPTTHSGLPSLTSRKVRLHA